MTFGPYRVVRTLGSGSFGAVYEALQMPLGKRVALKVMHSHIADQAEPVQRFRLEAQALVRLRHPNVVDVLDLGEIDGRPYLAMEYLEGETLSARIERSAPMPVSVAADLLVPVCVAVAAAHDQQIVHRDLKPDNIFIAQALGADHLKLLDFGIAKLVVPDGSFAGTATSSMLGTPYYMAPEQVQSTRSVGPHADQWALGVILWECLTGHKPFIGDSLFDVLQQVISRPLPPLLSLRPDLPPAFAVGVQQSLSRDPAQRLASVRHLGLALLPMASDRVRATFTSALSAASVRHAPPSMPTLVAPAPQAAPIQMSTERASNVELNIRPAPRRASHFAVATVALLGATALSAALLGRRASEETAPSRPSALVTRASAHASEIITPRAAARAATVTPAPVALAPTPVARRPAPAFPAPTVAPTPMVMATPPAPSASRHPRRNRPPRPEPTGLQSMPAAPAPPSSPPPSVQPRSGSLNGSEF